MHYYEHHIGDYAQATAHLSFVEDAAYCRLMRKYYAEEKPLPTDIKAVQRLVGARSREERDAVSTVLGEFFFLNEDGWHNKRCDIEISKYQDKQQKAKRSANARWEKSKSQSEGNANASANAMRTHSEGNAHRTPSTSTPNPLSSVVDNSTLVAREQHPPAALLDPLPEIPDTPTTRRGIVCRLLRQAGVTDAAPHHLTDETWDQILTKRTDEEIVEFARSTVERRAGQRTGLKYLAPGLLQDPEPIGTGPPARASPRMSARDAARLAAARTIFGTDIEASPHGIAAADRTIDITPSATGALGIEDLRRDAG